MTNPRNQLNEFSVGGPIAVATVMKVLSGEREPLSFSSYFLMGLLPIKVTATPTAAASRHAHKSSDWLSHLLGA